MKTLFILTLIIMNTTIINAQSKGSIFQFQVTDINGKNYNLADLKGKKVMIVNVASKCGLTPQYKELEELYKEYGGPRFIIVAFPANNFLSQEPGTNEEIKEFCTKNYGVSFPVMSKISVKGKDIHPLYKWLTNKSENGVMDAEVGWNFQKFLIDENGQLVEMIPPRQSPKSDKVIAWIKGK